MEVRVSKGAQIAVGASIIALMLGWYSYAQLEGEGSYRYYQTLTEFRAAQAERAMTERVSKLTDSPRFSSDLGSK